MNPTARELPDQPGVDRSGEQSAIARDERDLWLLEQPLDLRRREIRIGAESRAFGDERRFAFQLCTPFRGTPVLPNDRARERLSGVAMPKDNRLTLIGDPDHVRSDSTDRNRITRRE